ncbi:hypothetical protein [Faecalispora anaeroviscerum]|uniref:hypothetical protein n=1 Tax=Faecalispora anaeroviscerum TaxID=2991836 RepID=UPI0024BB9E49|nr:hypothetical protein [Faecalispora anaeroviscerum]
MNKIQGKIPAWYGQREALRDEEGVQTIRKNARCMVWLLKIIEAGKERMPFPEGKDHFMAEARCELTAFQIGLFCPVLGSIIIKNCFLN